MSDVEEMAQEYSLAMRLGDIPAAHHILCELIAHARTLSLDSLEKMADGLERQLKCGDFDAALKITTGMASVAAQHDVIAHNPFGHGFRMAYGRAYEAIDRAGY